MHMINVNQNVDKHKVNGSLYRYGKERYDVAIKNESEVD